MQKHSDKIFIEDLHIAVPPGVPGVTITRTRTNG